MSFGVIPRLNVAGRLKHAKLSLDILLSEDSQEANRIANELDDLNKQRQKLTEKAFGEAHRQVSIDDNGNPPAIIFAGKATWAPGILGLIASRLSEEFHRPAIAACGQNGLYRGSGRSIPEFNLISALSQCEEHFEAYGGHPMAAGFTIKEQSLKNFRSALTAIGQTQMTDIPQGPSLTIEKSIPFSWINRENLDFISRLEPFGNGNPNPVFMTPNVSILGVRQIGANKNHLKMTVEDQGKIFDTICFRQGPRIKEAYGSLDIAYTASTSYWSGRETIELTVQDFRPATII
jgi:single-stranded-DNA-specific exonuclease